MIVDTPGFSAMNVNSILPEEVQNYYNEFIPYIHECKFLGCLHNKEPDCAVKNAVQRGKLPVGRYERYIRILEMLDQEKGGGSGGKDCPFNSVSRLCKN